MNLYLKGILRGLEISYKRLDQIDPENTNVELTGVKLILLRTIQHWRQIACIRELDLKDLDKLKDIEDMDELDNKLCELHRNYVNFLSGKIKDLDEDEDNLDDTFISDPKYIC